MKKANILLFTALLTLSATSLFAQPTGKGKKGKEESQTTIATPVETKAAVNSSFDDAVGVFHQSLRYADFASSAYALNQIIVLRPDLKAYKDTLAYIYVELGGNVQALSVARDILKDNPNNTAILEVSAMSEEALGLYKEALEDYEKLFKATAKPYHMYKVASMQYVLKRFGECSLSINTLIKNPDIDKEKISINMDRGQRQEVPMKAALYNMLGMVAYEVNDLANAKTNFNEALKLEPNFVLAKGNIDLIAKAEAEKAPKTPTTNTPPKTGTAPKKQ